MGSIRVPDPFHHGYRYGDTAGLLEDYASLLSEMGYTKEFENDVANVYEGRIVRYTKPVGENAVEFDALVGALRCRQTDAEWSYSYLEDHSVVEPLEVAEGLEARVPVKPFISPLRRYLKDTDGTAYFEPSTE